MAASDCEYGVLTVPGGSEEVLTVSAGPLTVMFSDFVAVAFEASVTWTVKAEVPAAVGVPEMVAPLSESPAGSEPDWMDHV